MTEPREIELKLALDPAHIPGLRERGLRRLGAGAARPERLVSTYYDTDTFALRGKGLSLRVRQAGERRIQTVKAEGAPGAGYFDRSEWETEIESDEPDLDAFPDTPFGKAVKPKRVRSRVRPIFTTEVERTTWLVEKPDHAVEVTLDHGTVQADGRSVAIAELELELKRGRPDHLFDLARLLDRSSPLAIGVETKSARGYALLNGGAEAVKAAPIELRRGMTTAEAFQVIARSCLATSA
jgi:inorganic triphosphatase YgiF